MPTQNKKTIILWGLSLLILLIATIMANFSSIQRSFNVSKKAAETEIKEFSQIYPLSAKDKKLAFRISVNGITNLESDTSYLRIILVDDKKEEYLVYETSPLLADGKLISFTDACDETCLLEGVIPSHLKIDGYRAIFRLDKVNFSNLSKANISLEREKLLKQNELNKIAKINQQIRIKGLKWIAGETSVSKLTYAEKKKLFSKPDGQPVDILPNLQGFEYYKGGIFEIRSESVSPTPTPPPLQLPASWDWRNVHGENWMTVAKDQDGCGSCWAFSGIGTLEASINLYYNRHLDFDLSEQDIVSCSGVGGCYGGSGASVLYYTKNVGVVDEDCFRYEAKDAPCSQKCSLWDSRILRQREFESYNYLDENILKRLIIEKGPASVAILSLGHSMVLAGYGEKSDWKLLQDCNGYFPRKFCVLERGGCIDWRCDPEGEEMTSCMNNYSYDWAMFGAKYTYQCKDSFWSFKGVEFCPQDMLCVDGQCREKTYFDLVPGHKECFVGSKFLQEYSEYSPRGGEPYWIFKNSWGDGWGERGYVRMNFSSFSMIDPAVAIGPITLPQDHSSWPAGFDGTIRCVDKDNDTYCNWGISETKPLTCPSFCKPQKDCDDSSPNLGPFDVNLNCVNLAPIPRFNCTFCDVDGDRIFCQSDVDNPLYKDCQGKVVADYPNCQQFDVAVDGIINGKDFSVCVTYCYGGRRCPAAVIPSVAPLSPSP